MLQMVFQSTSVISDGRIVATEAFPMGFLVFQSTSVISDGRILFLDLVDSVVKAFQSTSVISDGRIVCVWALGEIEAIVSIHVRHF